MTRRNAFLAFVLLNVYACKSIATTQQTAETLTDAAQTQSKIDRAAELAADIKTAKTPDARALATERYVIASTNALAASDETIENLKKSFIFSESARGELAQKLSDCQADASTWAWLKWLLPIFAPLAIAGAFMIGRKTA